MLVDGEGGDDEVVGTNDVKGNPLARLGIDNLTRASGSLAAAEDTGGQELGVTSATESNVDVLGRKAAIVMSVKAAPQNDSLGYSRFVGELGAGNERQEHLLDLSERLLNLGVV